MTSPKDTFKGPSPTIEDAHYAEVMRRCELIDAGQMDLIPWEEVEAHIFGSEPDPEIEAAWEAELQRRRKLLDEGKLELFTWEQVRAELYAEDDDEETETP